MSQIKIKGTSMCPSIMDEDVVEIQRQKTANKWDIVCFKQNNRYVLHRCYKIKEGYIVARGDNRKEYEKVSTKNILGIMTKNISKNKKIKNNALKTYYYKSINRLTKMFPKKTWKEKICKILT